MTNPPTTKPAVPDGLPGALTTRQAQQEIGCKKTKLWELIISGEVESYLDGGTRMVTTASILARRQRLLARAARRNEHTRKMTVRSLRARRKQQENQITS
jgi:hypothetical protein